MAILKMRRKDNPIVMWPEDVDIDVHMDPFTGEYSDVVRFRQQGLNDVILRVKHGGFADIASQLESVKQELFP